MVYMGREIIGIEYIGEEREVRQLKILKDKLKFQQLQALFYLAR